MTTLEKIMAKDCWQEHELHVKDKKYNKYCSTCYTMQKERIAMFRKGRSENNNFTLAQLEKLDKFRTE